MNNVNNFWMVVDSLEPPGLYGIQDDRLEGEILRIFYHDWTQKQIYRHDFHITAMRMDGAGNPSIFSNVKRSLILTFPSKKPITRLAIVVLIASLVPPSYIAGEIRCMSATLNFIRYFYNQETTDIFKKALIGIGYCTEFDLLDKDQQLIEIDNAKNKIALWRKQLGI